jgi:hypothetical protein
VRRTAVATAVVGAALACPGAALAHVGKSAPVATNFQARVTGRVPGIDARVVDGDQALWLRAGRHTVTVPGAEAEPLLRFDAGGVWVNLRSLTAQIDRIDRFDLSPSVDPHAAPRWHRLTRGHAYRWHEHRLHALEPLAAGRAAVLGRWSLPLVVDGRRRPLAGVLDYRPPPPVWAWTGAAALLAVAAALLARRRPRGAVALALPGVLAAWALRISRELYGRPAVGAVGWIEVALTCVVGVALVWGLLRRDEAVRRFTAFLAGFGCLYQGLTMQAVLTHAVALTLLPTAAARLLVVVSLGLGAGALAGGWRSLAAQPVSERELDRIERSAA